MRNLIEEVRNRRVLAFAALGVLVALALPLLFLKSAPEGAPTANTAAPAPAKEAKLPARAARLLATSDAGAPAGQATGSAQDPFSPPESYMAAAAAAAAKGDAAATPAPTQSGSTAPKAAAGGGAAGKPVEVVVTNPNPKPKPKPNATPSASGSGSSSSQPSRSLTARNASVDVRYGPMANTKIRRAIPRQQGFYIHGKLVAVFVKYSPSRKAAVFAVAPGVFVSGAAKCRAQDGVCRYVDIPAGSHAWLTAALPSRTIVSRRLDVVHIKRRAASSKTRAASAGARREAACLARKLVAMERGDALLDRDACQD